MKAYIAVNEAEFEQTNPLYELQAQALDINLSRLPQWARLTRLRVECEGGTLRCSCKAIGGPRHLPFVRDMLEAVYIQVQAEGERGAWIGIMNSDIVLTPLFFESLFFAPTSAVLTHRHKVDQAKIHSETGPGTVEPNCTDMILFREFMWTKFDLPDFVLGEPYWDLAAKAWVQEYAYNTFKDGECLHVDHKGAWQQGFTPTRTHNLKLFMDYMKARHYPIEPYIQQQWKVLQVKKALGGKK